MDFTSQILAIYEFSIFRFLARLTIIKYPGGVYPERLISHIVVLEWPSRSPDFAENNLFVNSVLNFIVKQCTLQIYVKQAMTI